MAVIGNNQTSPDDSLTKVVEGKPGTSAVRLNQLRYFVAAVDYGSFRKAAAALSVQESSISRRIRDLEDELGASLFMRHAGGVRLTVAGREFLRNARHALRQIDIGVTKVAAVGRAEQGLIKVGIFSSLASGFLFDLLRAFGTRHPNVQVDLIDGNPPEHIAAVRKLCLDVAFITGTAAWDGCEAEHLWCEKVFVVLPDNHPLAGKPELGWVDLASERFIVSDVAPGQEIHDYLVAHLAGLGRRRHDGDGPATHAAGAELEVAIEAVVQLAPRFLRDEFLDAGVRPGGELRGEKCAQVFRGGGEEFAGLHGRFDAIKGGHCSVR